MPNLEHVEDGLCSDLDCELHNIDVAIEEGVVTDSNVAFWLAGAAYAVKNFADEGDFHRFVEKIKATA